MTRAHRVSDGSKASMDLNGRQVMGKQRMGFAWVLLGIWLVLTVIMAVWAMRPSQFADTQATADFEYPWLGLSVLSMALAMLFLNEHALFTGSLGKRRPILALLLFSLMPLLMFVFAVFISMHAPDYVGLFILAVVCINVLHFSVGMVWIGWRFRQQK